ncbi:MAG: hypothetical protein JWM16_6485 [Verrucomicrobiales bacterium]|nr:hypothetical protein [Verrucomicrobiales bacterium]
MRPLYLFLSSFALVVWTVGGSAAPLESKLSAPYFDKFHPIKAPEPAGLLLKKGDRLAICGDSITEQKMYSRIMETYLTVCMPELEITARQYGWSGERAGGFLSRMTNDCLRFNPTIATTCYGMNDHEYKPYEARIGNIYWDRSTAIIRAFKAHGVRVVQGSPGAVGKMPDWVKTASGTVDDLNVNLCQLRDIGIAISRREHVAFADVFWPMLTTGYEAQQKYGTNYMITGKDGVHPGWAGQTEMAYAFLKALGCDGHIGTLTVNLASGKLKASKGHRVLSSQDGKYEMKSERYPFCATGKIDDDNSIRSGMALVPFNQNLNRFLLVGKGGKASNYKVTWGTNSKVYSAEALAKGVNLADDFVENPFCQAFQKVDKAVEAKQIYETKQIKEIFHGPEGKKDMETAVKMTEGERAPLAAAIRQSFVPVTYTLAIEPL